MLDINQDIAGHTRGQCQLFLCEAIAQALGTDTCAHRATRSGSFWLGRVGTHPSNGAVVPKVCPTGSTLLHSCSKLIPTLPLTKPCPP